MALVHQELYQAEHVTGVHLRDYLTSLVAGIAAGYGHTGIQTQVKVAPLLVDLSTAVPLGLVVNELVTNSYKHGFPAGGGGQISLRLEQQSDHLWVEVRDNGAGPAAERVQGFGRSLVRSLSRQMRAEVLEYGSEGMVTELKIFKFRLIEHG